MKIRGIIRILVTSRVRNKRNQFLIAVRNIIEEYYWIMHLHYYNEALFIDIKLDFIQLGHYIIIFFLVGFSMLILFQSRTIFCSYSCSNTPPSIEVICTKLVVVINKSGKGLVEDICKLISTSLILLQYLLMF